MKETINNYIMYLEEKRSYLEKVRDFLMNMPGLFETEQLNSFELNNFIESYELKTLKYSCEHREHLQKISVKLNIPVRRISFSRLTNLGYPELREPGLIIISLTNKIKMLLLKISVFLRNYSELNREFRKLNTFFMQNNYTPQGVEKGNESGLHLMKEA